MQKHKTVFISYRRDDVFMALLVYKNLSQHGFDVFFDYDNIGSGDWEQIILSEIEARAHFIVILTPTALDRCGNPNDVFRKEIEQAIDTQRNVIPLLFNGFDFGNDNIKGHLKGKLALLSKYNGKMIYPSEFDEIMKKIRGDKYLDRSLNTVIHPSLETAHELVDQQKEKALEVKIPKEFFSAQLAFEKGMQAAKKEKHTEAIRYFTQAIELSPKRAEAYNNRGVHCNALKKHDEAIFDLKHALTLNPYFPDAHNNLAVVYMDTEDWENAAYYCSKAIELSPKFAKAHLNQGSIYSYQGDHNRAYDEYSLAIEFNPEYAQAYANRGYASVQLGNYNEAIKDCKKAIEIDPKEATAYNNIGLSYSYQYEYKTSLHYFRKAKALDHKPLHVLYNIAISTARLRGAIRANNQIDAVEPQIKKLLKSKKDRERGWAYYALGGINALYPERHDKALDNLEKAIELSPEAKGWARREVAWLDLRENPRFIELTREDE